MTTSRIKYYFHIWFLMTKNAFLSYIQDRLSFVIFLVGKVVRFVFYIAFITFLLKGTKTLAGYNLDQTLFFFITFVMIDTMAQFFFRGVYRFRGMVVDGGLDLILVKPSNALFRSLLSGGDLMDLLLLPILIILVIHTGSVLNPTSIGVFSYVLLIINGLIISTSFHIAVIALGIVTLEVDHTIMIFRDLSSLGRFPIDIYKEPLKGLLTFLIPIGIMMTFPAKALMGLLSLPLILLSLLAGILSVYVAVKFWNYALRFYTSASS